MYEIRSADYWHGHRRVLLHGQERLRCHMTVNDITAVTVSPISGRSRDPASSSPSNRNGSGESERGGPPTHLDPSQLTWVPPRWRGIQWSCVNGVESRCTSTWPGRGEGEHAALDQLSDGLAQSSIRAAPLHFGAQMRHLTRLPANPT